MFILPATQDSIVNRDRPTCRALPERRMPRGSSESVVREGLSAWLHYALKYGLQCLSTAHTGG